MKFNEDKLRRLLSRADQLHAAVTRMQDEYVEAKAARGRYEMDLRAKGYDVGFMKSNITGRLSAKDRERIAEYADSAAEREERTLEQLASEEQVRLSERDAATEKWQQARRVADSCERYAREVLGWAPERPGTLHGAIAHMTGGVLR